jgi:hypothetical protein
MEVKVNILNLETDKKISLLVYDKIFAKHISG